MLPKIMPVFKNIHLPISDKDVKVYAFKIAEEKILLLNKDATPDELEDVIIELIQSKTEGVIVKDLTIVDIVVLLINIVDISRGLNRHLTYKCNNILENGNKCGNIIEMNINLANYKIIEGTSKNHQLIHVTDDIVCELEYPSYNTIHSLLKYKNDDSEYVMRLYSKLISAIYYNDDVYTGYTDDEIYEWALDLPHKALQEFEDYITSLPSITIEYDVVCPKCGAKDHYIIQNLIDFFTYDTQTKM